MRIKPFQILLITTATAALIACGPGASSSGGGYMGKGWIDFEGPPEEYTEFQKAIDLLQAKAPDLHAEVLGLSKIKIGKSENGGDGVQNRVFYVSTLQGNTVAFNAARFLHEATHEKRDQKQNGVYGPGKEYAALKRQIAACRRLGCTAREIDHLKGCRFHGETTAQNPKGGEWRC